MSDPLDQLGPGTGTASDPYIIKDLATLDAMRNEPDAYYMMIADVDIGGGLWEPFTFTGVLDGRGHTISNLQVDKSDGSNEAGLFSRLLNNAQVFDLNIETGGPTHVSANGTKYGGVLSGWLLNNARISRVSCRGQIDGGSDRYGGLVGYMDSASSMIECVAAVQLTGSSASRTGALIGFYSSSATVRNAVCSTAFSGEPKVVGSSGSSISGASNLSVAELGDASNYPDYFDFVTAVWEIADDNIARVVKRPVPIIETGGGGPGPAPAQARLAGTVTIDGSAAERRVIIVNNDPNGAQVVGEGVSNPDGNFDIEYGDFGFSVVALAIDDYGQAFEAETALTLGTIVHPTTPNGYVYEVTAAGTTGTEEPVWATVQTVQSGSVTFNPVPYYRPIASGPLTGEPVV